MLLFLQATLIPGPLGAAQDAPDTSESQIGHATAADFFEDARALEAENPWGGTLYGPILFVEPSSRYAVANQADSAGMLTPSATARGVFAGTLPDDVVIANTAMEWSGTRWTMLMWPLPAGHFARRVLLGHEMFHRLAPRLGLPGASPSNEHLDDAEGRLWLRLELRALALALASTGSARRTALADALAFRSRRRAIFPNSDREERALELNEGLAEYTGVHVALPPSARAGWAVEAIESRNVMAAGGGLSRSFAYATGPAYGLLLDDASPGWTRQIDESSDIAALAARAYGIDPSADADDSAAGARSRLSAYDGARLERFERERAVERERLQESYRARYLDGPVLTLPVDDNFRYGFNPNAVSTLDGVGQVLGTAEVRAGWGSLEVSDGVLLRRSGGSIVSVVVPAPDDPDSRPITGDGWTLALNEAWGVVPGDREGDFVVRRR